MAGACGAALLLLAGGSLIARSQTAPTKPDKKGPQATQEPQEGRPWRFTFDVLVHNDATGEGEATLVVATSDQDTVVKADVFQWNEKTKQARATGNLHLSDERTEGTADLVEIDYRRDRRLMVLTGNVRLVLKPRSRDEGKKESPKANGDGSASGNDEGKQTAGQTPPEENDEESPTAGIRNYPIEVTCDRVEYHYARDKRHAILTGNFKAVQKLKDHTRTLIAEKAEWFGLEERVLLRGPVKFEDTKGRKGETPEDVEIFTQEGKEGIKLRKGTYTMPVEEDEKGAPPTSDTSSKSGPDKGATP